MAILSRVMYTSPLADIIDHTESDKRLGHWLPSASPKEVRAYIRDHLETLYHPTSTARMAPLSEGGVVDARLKVHGIHGLRIVDASIFPNIISGHTVRSFTFSTLFSVRATVGLWYVEGHPPTGESSWRLFRYLLPVMVQICPCFHPRFSFREEMIMTYLMSTQASPVIAVAEKAVELIVEDLG
jgi:hypothetical protein